MYRLCWNSIKVILLAKHLAISQLTVEGFTENSCVGQNENSENCQNIIFRLLYDYIHVPLSVNYMFSVPVHHVYNYRTLQLNTRNGVHCKTMWHCVCWEWDSLVWVWGSGCVVSGTVWCGYGGVGVGEFGVGLGSEC